MEAAKGRLFSAVKECDLRRLQSVLNKMNVKNGQRAELINSVDNVGRTILHVAVETGLLRVVKWILSDSGGRAAGFNRVLARTGGGETALHISAKGGYFDVFLAVVEGCKIENGERAAILNAVNEQEWTTLHYAAFFGHVSIISWILSDSGGRVAGFNNVLARADEEETALYFALPSLSAFFAVMEGCKVENGEREAMLNAVSYNGESVLHLAASSGLEEIMNWLLSEKGREAGFNLDNVFMMNNNKESNLHLVLRSELPTDWLGRIFYQCRTAEERCRLLFGVDKDGYTPLHCAALLGRLSSLEWVTSHQQEERGGSNEDLFALTNDKESALHFAARGGSVECFDFLLSRCNNTSERLRLLLGRDIRGWTIFFDAAQNILFRAVLNNKGMFIAHILGKYPEESKMIIDARDYRGMTVLHRTIIGGIDEESREEWGSWHHQEDRQAVVASLLGLSYVQVEEGGHSEKDAVAMSNDEDDDETKKPIEEKKKVAIATVGADPNVGLKFE